MGWWIALAVLVLLAAMPLGVSVVYDADGPLIKVIAGFIRLKVFPAKKKKEKPKKEKKKDNKKDPAPEQSPQEPAAQEAPAEDTAAQEAPAEEAAAQEQKTDAGHKLSDKAKAEEAARKKKGGSILDFLPLVKVGLDFLAEFFGKKLHVNCLELKLTLAGGDPCDLALNYGRAWEALGNLWPRLERMMVIQKRDINIQCDFEGDKTLIYTRLDISITLGRLLGIAVRYGWRALVTFLKIRKKRKGGTKT
ncbi:MAG: DUF2953 domain-containing protein [Oscillospiraceae bacterium]|nr:DUF2953 domain-containing protein [Oscillospiraceae bacterium]